MRNEMKPAFLRHLIIQGELDSYRVSKQNVFIFKYSIMPPVKPGKDTDCGKWTRESLEI